MNNSRQLHRILERLEDRVLFDAVPDGGFLVQVEEAVESMAQNQQQLEQVTALHEESDQPRELILIDANVENADQLLDEILSQRADRLFEVQLISADQDGLDQISALLDKAENPYEAIHILSHGTQGSIQLGSSLITTDSLTNYAGEIAGWTDALTADADLMFYGCNLGGSATGLEFMEMMSVLSGADVAASTNLTGNSELGGDWELEANVGDVQTDELSLENYDSVFVITDSGFVIGNQTFANMNEIQIVPEGEPGTSSRLYQNAATADGGAISIDVLITLVNTYDENGNLTTGTGNEVPVTFSDFAGGPILLARNVGSSVNGYEGHTAEIRIEYLDSSNGQPISVVGEFTVKDIDYEAPTANGSGSEAVTVDGSQLNRYETSSIPASDVTYIDNGDGTLTFTNFISRGGENDEERWINLEFEDMSSVTMTFTARNANTGYGLSTDQFTNPPDPANSNVVPDATDDNFAVTVGNTVSGNVMTGNNGNGVDSDPDGDPLTLNQVNGALANIGNPLTGSGGGTFTVASNGSMLFDPGSDFDYLGAGETATTSITYGITDGLGLDDVATVTVTVTGVNDIPMPAGTIPTQNAEDAETIPTLDITSYFQDTDTNDVLTYSAAATLPPGLSLDPNTGIISGTINNDASLGGPYLVVIVADDGNGGTASQSFTWNVTNPAPIANDNDLGTSENQPWTGNVLTDNDGNGLDDDPDGDVLSVSEVNGSTVNVGVSVGGTNGGQFTINSDGSYDFDPGTDFDYLAPGESVVTEVTYTISDGQGGEDTATVSITISGTNDDPDTVGVIPNQTGADDTVAAPLDVTSFFDDVDDSDLTFSASGTLPPGLSIDPVTGIISGTYDSSASVGGPYTVIITANDEDGGSVQQSFTWNVTNPGPTATNDNFSTTENATVSGNVITGNNGNGVDSDVDGDSLIVSAVAGLAGNVGSAVSGSAGGQFTIGSNGSVLFNPGSDFDYLAASESVTTTVTYTVSDGEGGTDPATVTVTVNGLNDTPTQVGTIPTQNNVDSENVSTLDVSSFFGDPDTTDTLTYSAGGTLPPGLFIDPNTSEITGSLDSSASMGGPYSVTITADDSNGGTVQQTFTWNVTNPGPTANDDTYSTDQNTGLSGDVLTNDNDPDGDVITVTEVGNAMGTSPANVGVPYAGSTGGLFTVNNDGTYSFDSNGDFDYLAVGESVDTLITYEIQDADGAFDVATVVVTVNGTNDNPAANGTIPNQSSDDTDNTSVDVSSFFTDPDLSDMLSFSSSGLPSGLSVDPLSGVVSGTIDSSASQGGVGGVYSVTITATDDHGQSVDQTFSWTVTNPAPVAADDTVSTSEDTPVSGSVGGNDSDSDDAVSFNQLTGPSNGSVTFNPDGTFLYTPDPDFNGSDSFTYEIVDADGAAAMATVTINVGAINDPPVVDSPIIDQSDVDSDVINLDVSTNFSDSEGDTLTFSGTGLPPGLSIDAAGNITGTLDSSASAAGPYTVVITADDSNGGTVTDTFTWNITNPGPTAGNDSFSTPEDTPLTGSVAGNDSDSDGDALTFNQTSGPANGAVVFNPDGSFTYSPDPDFNGSDSFTYEVVDNDGAIATATVDITVNPVNDAPVVSPIADQASFDNDVINLDVSTNFSDIDGGVLTFSATALPPGLSIDAAGNITGTLDSSASTAGPYTVMVTADDGNGGTVTDTFTWAVSNPAPTAADDTFSTPEDTPVSGSVATNDGDVDGDSLIFNQLTSPTNGTILWNNDGTFTYTPNPDYFGIDTFDYEVVDADGAITTATVTLNVGSINDPPVVDSPVPDQSDLDSDVVNLDVSSNFRDPDGDTLTFSATGLPTGLSIDAAGNITGTLDSSASAGGPYTTVITANDGNGQTVTDTFTWNVANPGPVATDDGYTINEDNLLSSTVASNDSDADGDTLTYNQTSTPANGSVAFNSDGSFTYTPDPDFFGVDSFTYEVIDADGSISTATVTITVDPVNDAPTATPIPDQADVDRDVINLDVSTNFSDIDGGPLNFSATGLPPGLSIDVAGNITGTLDSSASAGGPYTVMVTANDGSGGSVSDTFTWTVTNPDPTATNDSFTTDEDTALNATVVGNDSDADSDALTFSQTSSPANGSVVFNPDGSFTYTPNANFNGLDSFTYEVVDADGAMATATVDITVDPVNDNPVVVAAVPDQTSADSEAIGLNVAGNFDDPADGDALTFSATGLPPGLSINAAGTITGVLDSSASAGGPYTVIVTADDGNGGTVTDTFTWTVTNPTPTAVDDTFSTPEDTPVSGSVATNDGDVDGDTLTHNQLTSPANGTVVWNNDGTFTYTPNSGYFGTDTFDYEVVDADGATTTATVTLNVGSVNDPPVVDSPVPNQADLDSDVINLDVSGNFSDPEGDTLTFSATGLPPGLSIDASGNITGTLDSSASAGGPYTVVITANDGNGGSVTDTFTWNVANPGPGATDDGFSINEDNLLFSTVASNDSDADGDALTFSQTSSPANGSVVFNPDGSFTYTPDPDFFGIDMFTYDVADADGAIATATVTITVDPVNDAPTVTPVPDQADFDSDVINLDVSSNFSDIDGILTFSATGLPPGLSIDAAGNISGTLDSSASAGGPYTVMVTADDGNGGSVTDTFTWTVANPAPTAVNDTFNTSEDTPVSGSVAGNDGDVDGDALTFNQLTGPANGTLVWNNNGTFTYTPNSGYFGTDTFDYEVVDADGATTIATVTLNVGSVNDPPVVDSPVPDQTNVDSEVINVDVSTNFSDPEGDTLTFSATGLPPGVSLDAAGNISGTLDSSASAGGPYTVVITADDGNGGSVTDTFTWTVTNPAPTAANDAFNTNEDSTLNATVATNDSDVDGDALTFSQTSSPTNGSLAFNPNGSFTYTPNADFNGNDSFTYEVVDADGAVTSATVDITVDPVNDAPISLPLPDQSDLDSDVVNQDLSGNFADPEGDTLTFSATGLPPGLSMDTAGIITGTLDSSASTGGPYAVTVTVDDSNGGTNSQSFTWTVVNPAPVASNDSFSTNEDTVYLGNVTGNDTDADADTHTYNQLTNPANGTLVWNNDGTFTYTPDADFNGTDSFQYEMVDADGASSLATVTVVVDPVNDAPVVDVVVPDQSSVDGDAVSLDIAANFSDADGDTLTFSATGLPPGLSIDAAGNITGTLDSSASAGGPYTVTVTVDDGNGGSVTDTFDWTVSNPGPVAANDSFSTNEDVSVSGSVAGNDNDPDDDVLTFNQLSSPANGSLVFNNDGSFNYTPNADFFGTDTFTYEILDADGATSTATVTINIASVNDAPVVDATIPDQSNLDSDVVNVDVSGNFSDLEGDTLVFSATGLPPGLSIDGVTGTITGTLDSSASTAGPYNVSITSNDGNGGTVTDTFVWSVVNPAPVANDDGFTTNEDVSLAGSVAGNDSDADGDSLTFNQLTSPANGALVFYNDGTFTYTPNADFNGTDSFTYEVVDADGATTTALATIVVDPVNDNPVVDVTIADQANLDSDVVSVDVSGNFNDVDGDTLTFSASGLPTGLSIDGVSGVISGTLDSSASTGGPYSVNVTVDDGNGGTVTETFNWTVTNPGPNAVNDGISTAEDVPVSGDASLNDSDVDGDTLVYNQLTSPANGSLVWNNDGTFTYTPGLNFTGIDSFDYEVVDADGSLATATVTISVGNVNDPPTVVTPIADQTDGDNDPISLNVAGNFNDVDGDALTFSATGLPPGLSIDAAGNITGTLDSSASAGGPYTVVITADDGNPGGTATDTFTWTVLNPAPTATDNSGAVTEDTALTETGNVLTDDDGAGTDNDADGDALTVASVDGQPAGVTVNGSFGTLQVNADGTYTYTLDNTNPLVQQLDVGEMLNDTFTYTLTDSEGGTATATLDITVNGTNDAPIPSPVPNQANLDTDTATLDMSTFFSDVDDPTLIYSVAGLPSGLSIDPATGVISGTIDGSASTGGPASDGVYTVFVTAQDDNGEFSVNSFTWTVANPLPSAGDDSFSTNEDSALSGVVTGNDADPDGDTLTYNPLTTPSFGALTFNNDGTFTYTPNTDFFGTDTFDYEMVDADGGTSVATVTIDVASVNDLPTVTPLPDQADLDSDLINVNMSTNFTDVEMALTFSATGLPPGLSIDPVSGLINGTLDSSASVGGPYTVVITADDGDGGSVSDTFTWNIANPGPAASDDGFAISEDTPFSDTVAGNDNDPDGDALTFTLLSTTPNGTLSFNPDGSFNYTPNTGYNGLDSFDYQVTDTDGATATATAFINIGAVNDLPVVDTPIPDQLNQDSQTVSVDGGSGFSDPDGDTLTFSATGLPPGLSIDSVSGFINGTLDSSASAAGPYTVVVTADDGNGGLISDTFSWTVTNPAPVAVDDTVSTSEDTPFSGSVTGNDGDPDGDTSTYAISSLPSSGTVAFNTDGSFTYTPGLNFNGTDSFQYTMTDADGATSTATVNINVGGTNDVPVSTAIPPQTNLDADVVSLDVSGNYSDPDGDPLSFSATGLPPGLTIDPVTGVISGTIDSSASTGGPYPVTVTVDDGNGGTVDETFSWSVNNPGPTAVDDVFGTNEDTPFTDTVASNDSDPDDAVTFNITSSPANGTITFNADGSFSYTPNADFFGTDTFTYEVVDTDGATSPASVTINVTPQNDAPIVSTPLPDLTNLDSQAPTVDVSGAFSDVDGDPLTYTATGLPTGLTLDPVTGVISGTIDSSASVVGPYSVTVTADDGNGGTVNETFVWTVNNPAPAAIDDNTSTLEDNPVSSTVAGNDSDPDGDSMTYALNTGPANGTATMNPDGSYTYTPNAGFYGTDSFTYDAVDADGAASTATVTIDVIEDPQPPVANDDSATTSRSQPVTVNLLGNDTDPDNLTIKVVEIEGQPITFGQPITLASGATVTVFANGTATFDPNGVYDNLEGGDVATDSFQYTLENNRGLRDTAVATVNIDGQANFAFDAFRNEGEPNRNLNRDMSLSREILMSERIDMLAGEPIIAGYAAPGTILVARLYAPDGSMVGEVTSQADLAGNFVINFAGTPQTRNARVVVEHIASEVVALGRANFSLTEDTYRSLQLEAHQKPSPTIGSILSDRPSLTLEQLHRFNNNPLDLL